MTDSYDAIIIGAGQSGPFLAARLADAGKKVALIEKRQLGGTCVNDGCTPPRPWWPAPALPGPPARPAISAS